MSSQATLIQTVPPFPPAPLGRLDSWQAVQDFVFAGTATFTLRSTATGARFTYKVSVKKEDRKRLGEERDLRQHAAECGTQLEFRPPFTEADVTYFVNLLRGPDNDADFSYMGVLRKEPPRFFWTAASGKVSRSAPAYKALVWFVDAMRQERDVLGSKLGVWHEGRCGRCGRKLTVPESITAGLGPECQGRAM
jgi:hypothetical protein